MARKITKTIYKFEELSDDAKEKAREWYRADALHYEWYDACYDGFIDACKILGVDIAGSKSSITVAYSLTL